MAMTDISKFVKVRELSRKCAEALQETLRRKAQLKHLKELQAPKFLIDNERSLVRKYEDKWLELLTEQSLMVAGNPELGAAVDLDAIAKVRPM